MSRKSPVRLYETAAGEITDAAEDGVLLVVGEGCLVPPAYVDRVAAFLGDDPVPAAAAEPADDEPAAGDDAPAGDPVPARNASRDAWAEYASSLGVAFGDDDGRDDLIELVAAHQKG